jgi:carboxyl-terminal processing protease
MYSNDPDPIGLRPNPIPTTPVLPSEPPRGSRTTSILHLAVIVVAVLAGGALFMSGYTLGRQESTQPGTPVTEDEAFQPFWDAYHAVTERYAGGEVDRKKIIEGAIKGMIEALGDPYSSYLTSEEYKSSLQGIGGEFEGIGAEIGTVKADGTTTDCTTLGPDCRLVIIAPIEGSPAQAAGIRPGDIVTAADGTSLDGLTIDEARDRIRGPKGTKVRLTVVRDGGSPFDVEITRDVIQQKEVIERDLAGGDVGYVKLTGFSDDAAKDFHDVLKADVDAGRTKIILDLRGNPGGYVTTAQDVASEFVKDGVLFWQEDAKGTQTPTKATGDGAATDPGIDLVVLIDKGSASASEIVAGALQDRDRATLVGETTFGKGTVQQWQTLEGDHGGFRLTVAKWLTPDKHWIHHQGIVPDVAVTVPADAPTGVDPALDKALEVLGETTALGHAA